jgi:signal transduction histidine kinase
MAQWVGISMERRISFEKDNARNAAEAANQAKGTFLANMSHELRTPINAILGYGEILLEDCEEFGNDQMKQDLGKIQIAGKHLTKLISNILDLAKIEAGKVDISCVNIDIHALVYEIADTARPLIEKNHNQFSIKIDDNVGEMDSDPTMIQQIILNLLGNAAKYCKNGTVELVVTKVVTAGTELTRFEIIDTGIGISENQLEMIFNEFSQANSGVSADNVGIGLGLSISKKYSTLLKGKVSVTSALGKGSNFSVTLPNNNELSNLQNIDEKRYSAS